ncbi:sugar transferase [Pseudactinotalea suaedae]|uniref:sugar transferase n=1 Tax=Pseudactinotalea suaedae TaxID=1524924 RepID=UPI0012E1932D|nr:sugar transferase [Pseudactinotalea suaedae]
MVKRILDVAAAGSGLVLLSPVLMGVAIAVRLKLGRPVLFRQLRPGKDCTPFTLLKFRSMHGVNHVKGLVSDAQRLTPFGRALRAASLDELPTLWNVLCGDMSMVGPRPLLMEYVERYTPEQARRHEVRPGITGLAQVSGRNRLPWQERLILDARYVSERSLLLDAWIIFKTVGVVIRREGSSEPGHVTSSIFNGNTTT